MRILSIFFASIIVLITPVVAQKKSSEVAITHPQLLNAFQHPPESAKPWVFWYWMNGAVSPEGIRADLEAMKYAGIGGAYLMPIKDTLNPSIYQPTARQLSPQWFKMVKYAMTESKRLGLKLAMHVSDGFALAGGPWITPELSMQKVVWTQTNLTGGKQFNDTLARPETDEGYYRDIAVFAFPSVIGAGVSTQTIIPKVTTSKADFDGQSLIVANNTKTFSSDTASWIQYEFKEPFTCRSIIIHSRNNYQANRLLIEVSDDGKTFKSAGRLDPPRHGWQDVDADYTHAIPATTARYFKFIYDKAGSEPGAEDLDAAKWKPSLKVTSIELSSEPRINQYEGKNGEVWRISQRTTEEQVSRNICVPLKNIINLTKKLDKIGRLIWNVPAGNWTILRVGHTSTGHRNDTGGGGKGLECDKFNTSAIKLQFDSWFGEIIKQVGPALAKDVLKVFHVDSWECGSQNWSTDFANEFKKRRGYDLTNYLPVMAGIPVESADVSESFLHDVRQTIAELINDKFYVTLAKLAHEKGCTFSAESVAPTMVGDGMLHYKNADLSMGEFWLNSPTHDKPNDMLDAISGAHIYGKRIIQAEAFTTVRMDWSEHPGMLKTLQDRNYALGINKLVYHVFTHNPWLNKKPGMTLDGVGLYFQRDQTWWKQGKAWVDYAQRCQALLQMGEPVTDIAVFTGEEVPRRSVLPDRLVSTLPGIFGEEIVKREADRLANKGEPMSELPAGVRHSANIADTKDWVDPLHGYAYDSFNPDALSMATVTNDQVRLPGGAKYKILVLPGRTKMDPNGKQLSLKASQQLQKLIDSGATVILNDIKRPTINDNGAERLNGPIRGRVIKGPFTESSFAAFGLTKDFIATDASGAAAEGIAWTHRATSGLDIYFISNQDNSQKQVDLSLRVAGRLPEIFDPVTGKVFSATEWKQEKGRTILPIQLDANASLFIILQQPSNKQSTNTAKNWAVYKQIELVQGSWSIKFNETLGGPSKPAIFNQLTDWSKHPDSAIRYYSGTAVYSKDFNWSTSTSDKKVVINLGKVENIAEVFVNGTSCGIVWTQPYRVDITKALKQGVNNLKIEITNTWANRLIGDHRLPEEKRITNTTAPFRLEGKPLLPAGLLGPVIIETNK